MDTLHGDKFSTLLQIMIRSNLTPTAPLVTSERVHLLDALRGFAIFGMWIVNVTVDVGWSYRLELMPMTRAADRKYKALFLAYWRVQRPELVHSQPCH